jgi:hypothetical protein
MSASIQRRFHSCFGFPNVRQESFERLLRQLHDRHSFCHQSLTFSHRELRVFECQAYDAAQLECSTADRLPNYPRAFHPARSSEDCGLVDDRATVVPILGHGMMIERPNPQLAQVP